MGSVKRTTLFQTHRELGAKLTEFGGFEMPLSYRGIIEEHRAVRTAAGLFDLSHMGEFEVSGSGALAMLERTLTNSAAEVGRHAQAQYTILCTEDGGTIDDLIVYRRRPDSYMLCVNASNIMPDLEWFEFAYGWRCRVTGTLATKTALIAGPRTARRERFCERLTAVHTGYAQAAFTQLKAKSLESDASPRAPAIRAKTGSSYSARRRMRAAYSR